MAIIVLLAASADYLRALNAVNLGICISIRIKAGSASREILRRQCGFARKVAESH